MSIEGSQWGSIFPRYTTTFESRIDASFKRYTEGKESISGVSHGMIPLGLLETTLAVGENMHKIGFHSGDKIFPVLMKTIRRYVDVHGEVFNYYYGFLCVRHLIRMVCVGILTEEGIFDKTLESINPDTPWQTISGCLAQKVMLDVLKDKPPLESECILGDVSKYRGAFAMHGGLSPGDAAFLSHVIWKSRKAIIPLRRQGLLPGLPVLILVLCQMTILSKTQKPVTQPWVRMQDLLMRCYLGGMTTDEQIILRWLGMSTYRLAIESKVEGINEHSPVDELDLRVIAQAYIELWTPSSESSGAQNAYLDLPMAVSGWIYHLMDVPGQQELRAEELVPRLIKVGFDLLAHELDVEQHNPQSASQKQFLGVGGLIIALLQHISYIVPAIKSPAVREDFICSLHEFDFYGLVGRGLLLVTRESDTANELGSTYIRVGLELIQCLKRFRRDLSALPAPPYCLLESADIEWRKVDSLLHYKLYSCLHVPAPLYEAAMKAWRGVYPPSIVEEFNYYQCVYPRCPRPWVYGRAPETKLRCAKCGEAKYCSVSCQDAHWALSTCDSHSNLCRGGFV